MTKKGVAKISTYLIALIVIGALLTGLLTMISTADSQATAFLSNSQEENTSQTLENSFSHILNNTQNANQEINDSFSSTPQEGTFGFLDSLINSGFSTLKNLFNSLSFMTVTLGNLHNLGLPIPSWVGGALLSIIIILIAFGIYRFIFKVDN